MQYRSGMRYSIIVGFIALILVTSGGWAHVGVGGYRGVNRSDFPNVNNANINVDSNFYPYGAYPAGAYPAGRYPAGSYPYGGYPNNSNYGFTIDRSNIQNFKFNDFNNGARNSH